MFLLPLLLTLTLCTRRSKFVEGQVWFMGGKMLKITVQLIFSNVAKQVTCFCRPCYWPLPFKPEDQNLNSPLLPLFISHRSRGKKSAIFKQIYHSANFLFPSQIMLVFSKEDAQTDSFVHAAERGGYVCQICKTSEEAMEQYINVQPDVRLPFISIVNIERIFWKVVA